MDAELQSIDARTSINLPAFRKFTKTHQALLFPAFQLQNQLQRKVLGVAFWHRASGRRVEICKGNYITMSTLMKMVSLVLSFPQSCLLLYVHLQPYLHCIQNAYLQHLGEGLYDRAVSDSNFLRMSSNARLIIKTTGTNHGRQQVESKQDAHKGGNRYAKCIYCIWSSV